MTLSCTTWTQKKCLGNCPGDVRGGGALDPMQYIKSLYVQRLWVVPHWLTDRRTAYQFLMTKLSTPLLKFFKHLNILLYLRIYCLVQQRVYQSRVHDVDERLDIWHGLQRVQLIAQLMESACVRAKGGHFELWQYGNRLSSHCSSDAMFQILRMF